MQLSPEIFEEAGELFRVHRQPVNRGEIRSATRALLACPVGAIGTLHPNQARFRPNARFSRSYAENPEN